jgi:hypothetical protein
MALLSEIYPLQTGPSGATGPVGSTGPVGATGPQGIIGITGATGPIPEGLFYATGDQIISGEKTFLADSFVFSGADVQFIGGTGTVSGAWNFRVRPTLNDHGLISANDLSGLAQNVIPATSGVYNLGSPEKPFKDIYLTTGSVYLGNAVISASGDSVVLPQGTVIAGGGALGATGPQGATGPAGSNGATGATGETGSAGATGATGTAGANGATGATGETGGAGATGATGTAGANGATGATGETGGAGATGATGTAGSNGATGATGETGIAGATGATGTAGSNGATGATGSGATGATGVAGLSGDKYTTTSTTSESIGTGSKTFTVDSGLALSTGQTVIIAYDASNKMEGTVTSYSVTTLVVNVTSVTGSGGPYTSWSISLSGAPGPQGATGLTGTAGSNGATGATGTAGSNGATGATGTAGSNGATGATGTAGSNGATGATGETGSAGATGATGTAGSNGATGATGVAGTDGATGATGTGATGATGPTGAAGSALAVAGFSWVHGATGATDDYANLSNGADNVMRFNTQIFNTDSNTFALINSGTNTARIEVKSAGYYEFTSQVHIFDLFNNVDVTVKLLRFEGSTGGTGALVSLLSDFKAAELTADQLINGTIVVNITSPGFYSVIVNPSANTPFPSDSDSTPTRVFVKKLSN